MALSDYINLFLFVLNVLVLLFRPLFYALKLDHKSGRGFRGKGVVKFFHLIIVSLSFLFGRLIVISVFLLIYIVPSTAESKVIVSLSALVADEIIWRQITSHRTLVNEPHIWKRILFNLLEIIELVPLTALFSSLLLLSFRDVIISLLFCGIAFNIGKEILDETG